ncbi:GntR family transcriptional regulator [Natronospirillum operosum]|uniref:GntR family transcriptional regulator n=1 Tax=Natronospirillum operosum TaxID=2759953 RepID=A0A4Z0WAK9_9GAMM|nr:GntR family transcriptional regulator [Natronospirillum operosum]TGG93395.1 GntR family transcriptional regulator [Natronospirillum operosum]
MSQVSMQVITELRRMISQGELAPGERLTETQIAQTLGVSRMPVRLAFRTLAQEGLLQQAGKRGFLIREFSEDDVICGLEIRGALEGLAARRLAERGLTDEVRAEFRHILQDGEELLTDQTLNDRKVEQWSAINARFHNTLVEAAGSPVIADAIARNNHLPFASSDSIMIDHNELEREFRKLQLAQWQHQLVVQAIEHGEGARADALMREHAYVGVRYGSLFGLQVRLRP